MNSASAKMCRLFRCGKAIGEMPADTSSGMLEVNGKAIRDSSSRRGKLDRISVTWLNVHPSNMANSNRNDTKVDGKAKFMGRKHLVMRRY